MTKLKQEFRELCQQMTDTYKASVHGDRHQLNVYVGMETILRMFDVKRLPLPRNVYMTSEEMLNEELADEFKRGTQSVETAQYKITVERKPGWKDREV